MVLTDSKKNELKNYNIHYIHNAKTIGPDREHHYVYFDAFCCCESNFTLREDGVHLIKKFLQMCEVPEQIAAIVYWRAISTLGSIADRVFLNEYHGVDMSLSKGRDDRWSLMMMYYSPCENQVQDK